VVSSHLLVVFIKFSIVGTVIIETLVFETTLNICPNPLADHSLFLFLSSSLLLFSPLLFSPFAIQIDSAPFSSWSPGFSKGADREQVLNPLAKFSNTTAEKFSIL
jgi:hypothetical protein